MLQVPHRVFIRLMPHSGVGILILAAHFLTSGSGAISQFLTIPTLKYSFPHCLIASSSHMKINGAAVANLDASRACSFDQIQAVAPPQKVVALPGNECPLGLPRLGLELRLLALDPAQLADHGQPHGIVADRPAAQPPAPGRSAGRRPGAGS